MRQTQLEDTAEILKAVQLVTRTQIMLVKRFDTHTRLMDALNEKQALNECETGHWSWIRDLKDDLAQPTKPGEGRGRPLPHVSPRGLFGPLAPGLKTGYPG
jgi:hypothetical protein